MKPKLNQTITDLMGKIDEFGSVHDAVYMTKPADDLSKVNFDFENLEPFGYEDSYNHLPGLEKLDGYEMVGEVYKAFPILWCAAGGDWELPLVFVLYIGEDDNLHAYIPDDGNCYNREKMSAYGNNEGDPEYGTGDPRYVFDVEKMKGDILNHFL